MDWLKWLLRSCLICNTLSQKWLHELIAVISVIPLLSKFPHLPPDHLLSNDLLRVLLIDVRAGLFEYNVPDSPLALQLINQVYNGNEGDFSYRWYSLGRWCLAFGLRSGRQGLWSDATRGSWSWLAPACQRACGRRRSPASYAGSTAFGLGGFGWAPASKHPRYLLGRSPKLLWSEALSRKSWHWLFHQDELTQSQFQSCLYHQVHPVYLGLRNKRSYIC